VRGLPLTRSLTTCHDIEVRWVGMLEPIWLVSLGLCGCVSLQPPEAQFPAGDLTPARVQADVSKPEIDELHEIELEIRSSDGPDRASASGRSSTSISPAGSAT
jgi:hypothetical protein